MTEPHEVSPNRTISQGDRLFHGLAAAALAGMVAASLWPADVATMPPAFGVGGNGSICMLRRVTGMPCPTCGVTRSFRALGQGALVAAVRFHPLGPVYFALLMVVMVRSAGIAVRGRRWLDGTARVMAWSLPVLVLATLAVYAVRMWLFFASGMGAAAWAASPMGRLVAALG